MNVALVYREAFKEHRTGPSHPERPARLDAVIGGLREARLYEAMPALDFEPAPVERIAALHDPAYIERVRETCDSGGGYLDSLDTPVCERSYELARLAAGGTIAAAEAILAGEVSRAFCAVRPPGHHAEHGRAMGFCLFNNVALAAEHLIRVHGLERIAIVDFDVHHGNGTQHLFERRADVLFISLHEDPRYQFPGTGSTQEQGYDAGAGYTLNLPMLPGVGDDLFREVFTQKVIPRLDEYRPQMLLISAGFDAHRDDPLGHLELSTDCFAWMTEQLVASAERHAAGRVLSVLEGGYNLKALGACAAAHVRALAGD